MIQYNSTVIEFIKKHIQENPNALLLAAKKYPEIDIPFVVDQLVCRKQIKDKLPAWYSNYDLYFPARITTEQCSSVQTAAYKQRLASGNIACDMTGGLGIDSYYISRNFNKFFYLERYEVYCEAARHNFSVLDATNIDVLNGDSMQLLNELPALDLIYVDPARRSDCNKRLYDLTECEPNVVDLTPHLLTKATKLLVKVSPMADIQRCIELIPQTKRVHVLSVRNECKELLLEIDAETQKTDIEIVCVNYATSGEQSFSFNFNEEKETALNTINTVHTYLYEPNASILKAGAFKSVAKRFGIKKLHQHSHLYTSSDLIPDFPGRTFEVIGLDGFSKKWLQTAGKQIIQANLTTRNFPMTVAEIRKRSKLQEGGSLYLFATTLSDDQKVIISCEKLS
ncbi:MAG: THUMP-like domain-containing protein [Bacteroidales bacterium]